MVVLKKEGGGNTMKKQFKKVFIYVYGFIII